MKEVEIIKARNTLSSRAFRKTCERLRVAAYCRVSTDSEDQLNSYKSQVQHYTEYIAGKEEWVLVDIYADEAITGTQTKKREGFQRLINDCMNGEIDMIITKSISRFARNTLDTLNYVRMLKEKNIAVFFEEENINTLTMDGELLLTILSSVAQQEVENISANVKKGLKMKMQRGELVGFQGCLGYDYDPETKSISINENEAKIVRYIFERYNEGIGCFVISQELEKRGYKTKRGNSTWAESTVMGILKNEKYKGDIRQGKTFTVDPISKRRLDNFGEEDQFYIHNHHEGIISEELFESTQAIIQRRSRSKRNTDGKRETFTRKYSFSCMLECGFCASHLTRRSWHSGSAYHKVIWQCVTATKKGKQYCKCSKGIHEEIIEQAFLESYRLLCYNNKDVIDEMLERIELSLCSSDYAKEKSQVEMSIAALEKKRNKLLDMKLDDLIDQQTYEEKNAELIAKLENLNNELTMYANTESREKNIKKRLADFRKVLEQNETLVDFDRSVFESIIDKVIVGGYDDDGNPNPPMLTFIYKTGFTNNVDSSKHKTLCRNSNMDKAGISTKLCSFTNNEENNLCSDNGDNTCGDGSNAFPQINWQRYAKKNMYRRKMMQDYISKEIIDKGWSSDKKYCLTDKNGIRYLLRVSDIAQYDIKQTEFNMMKQVASLGVPMCQPIEFGICDDGVYSIQSWIDGEDAEQVISGYSDTEQYVYGLEAGRILRQIHSIPAPETQEDWEPRFNRKMDHKIKKYGECPIKYENGQAFIDYINENRHLLKNRPQVYQHGDYHIGNMMIDRNGQLHIIDFDRNDYGDPWEEFNRIVWCAQKAPLFASGMVNGYFDGEVPMKFWKLLALYISSNTLSSVYWAIPFGQDEVNTMLDQAKEVLSWYDNMRNPVPTWYFKGYYIQYIDRVPFKLKSVFDFGFLNEYGTVFKVYDDQDSGNICFGTEKDGQRYFIKFAGALTEQYNGYPADAISRLKATLPIYSDLQHKNLIELVEAKTVNGGFAMVFKWVDGDCMGRMYPASHRRFMQLPVNARLTIFSDILSFFECVVSHNYVAIDFYDGSIMYDFETGITTICDIDLFRKQPCTSDMGRMWGSSLFQSPEEYEFGAVIDEITNVYTVGATAFALFGGYDRTRDKWQLSDKLFEVATKAVSNDRNGRQQSIRQLREEWETAICTEY